MAESKKIIFEGIDKGVSSFYDKIRQRAKEANSDILRGAKEHSSTLKDQVRFMEESIKQIERQNKLYLEQQSTLLKVQKARELRGAKTTLERETIERKYETSKASISEESAADKTLINILRELLEVNKDQLKTDYDQVQAKKQESTRVNDRWEAQRSLWEQEVKEDKEGVKKKIRKGKWWGFKSEEEKFKRQYQESILSDKDKPQNIFKSILKANLVTEAIKGVAKSIGEMGTSAASMRDESNFAGQAYGALVGSIPYVGQGLGPGIQAAKEREEAAQRERDMARLRSRMVTGTNVDAMTQLGLTDAEANDLATRVAASGGSARNLADRTRQLTQLQYGYGLDQNLLLQQEGIGRMTGTGGAQNIVNLVSEMKRQGVIRGQDYSQLSELIQTQNVLTREQANNQIAPNANVISSIVAEFQKIGGAFGGERASQRLSMINRGLISPGDEFQQAQNFAALSSLNPNASYFDLLKMQNKGISQKGFLGKRLGQMEQQYGNTEDMSLAAMQAFGLNPEDAELLVQSFKGDRTRFDEMGFKSVEDLRGAIGARTGEAGATGVSKFEIQAATIEEAFAENFIKGVGEAMKIAGEKLGKELVDDFTAAFGESAKNELDTSVKRNKRH